MQELLKLHDEGKLDEYQAQWFRQTKDPEELFDCINDPHELHNLVDDPAYQNVLEELRQECDRWMTEINDNGLIPEDSLLLSLWPGMVQPETQAPVITFQEDKAQLTTETAGASLGYQLLRS